MTKDKFTLNDTLICKGIAILMMIFHHMYLAPERYEGATLDFSPFAESDVNTFANFFKICVGIYVFLSAYGLTCSYKKWNGGDSRFVAYRYFRMMMEFFFIYVLSIITSLFVNSSWNIENVYGKGGMFAAAWKMLIDALGIAELFGTPTFNATWWYMSLAIVIIILIPLLNKLYDKCGAILILAASALIPAACGINVVPLTRWLLCIALGIVFARTDALCTIKTGYRKLPVFAKITAFIGSCAVLFIFYKLRQGVLKGDFVEIWDSVIPVMVIIFAFLFIDNIPGISHTFKFLGTYSTIIFLTHTLIRGYWFKNLALLTENPWLNYVIFVFISLAVAIIIKLIIKLCRYNKLEELILRKIAEPKNIKERSINESE